LTSEVNLKILLVRLQHYHKFFRIKNNFWQSLPHKKVSSNKKSDFIESALTSNKLSDSFPMFLPTQRQVSMNGKDRTTYLILSLVTYSSNA
jgi:hypothetical protein